MCKPKAIVNFIMCYMYGMHTAVMIADIHSLLQFLHSSFVMSLICRISPHRGTSHQNPEEPSEDDDRDVQEERARAQSAMLSADQTEVKVDSLCFSYFSKGTFIHSEMYFSGFTF